MNPLWLRGCLIALFLLPYVLLLYHFPQIKLSDPAELWWAFKNTFAQSFFSALLSVVLGFFGALGLLHFQRRLNKKFLQGLEAFLMSLSFLPSLFVIVSVFHLFDPFPVGIVGIVITHVIICCGLVAVQLRPLLQMRLSRLSQFALVAGASQWQFLRASFGLYKQDLLTLFLLVFSFSFASFSIPLVVGGSMGTTLEVLIYEKIRIEADWSNAVALSVFQTLCLLLFSFLFVSRSHRTTEETQPVYILNSRLGLAWITMTNIFVVGAFTKSLFQSWGYWQEILMFWGDLVQGALGSFMIGLFTGGLVLALLLSVAYIWPDVWVDKFFRGFMSASTALVGFVFLILGSNTGLWGILKICVILVLVGFPTVYRMGWGQYLHSFEGQLQQARLMGASRAMIFRMISLPQIIERACFLAGMAAFWAAGDFAVSRIIASGSLSLAMMADSMMGSYRIYQASILTFFVIIVGIICFLIFRWVGNVCCRKLSTRLW